MSVGYVIHVIVTLYTGVDWQSPPGPMQIGTSDIFCDI